MEGEKTTRKRRFGTVITPNIEQIMASKRPKPSTFAANSNFAAWSKEEVINFLQHNNLPAATVQAFTGGLRFAC